MKNNKKKIKRLFYLRVAVLMTFFLGLCFAFSPLPVQAARLFGVTGDAQFNDPSLINRETLFVLDQTDASSTFVISLGNGNRGEAIAFNKDDGLLYHWSGNGNRNFFGGEFYESIDPITLAITHITLSGDNYFEVFAATHIPDTDEFLVVDDSKLLYRVTTGGAVTEIGVLDHFSKGLAFVDGTLYSIQQKWREGVLSLFEINPLTGETQIDPVTSEPISVEISLPDFTLIGSNGLATHPDTGELWGLLRDNLFDRHLVTIDPITGEATDFGIVGDELTAGFASIAFDTSTEFSDFTLKKTMVKFNHKLNNDEFMVKGEFVHGGDNINVINPINEVVIVKVGTSTIVIPPGSFEEKTAGKYKFKGKIDGAHVKMKIEETGFNTFAFRIKGRGVDLTGTSNPVSVRLVVGDDIGQSSIRLKGELNSLKKGKK